MSKKRKSAKTTTTEADLGIVRWEKEQSGYVFHVYRAEAHMCNDEILMVRLEKISKAG